MFDLSIIHDFVIAFFKKNERNKTENFYLHKRDMNREKKPRFL